MTTSHDPIQRLDQLLVLALEAAEREAVADVALILREAVKVAQRVPKCERRVYGDWSTCDRCGSTWTATIHGDGWFPISCPMRAR